MTREGTIVSDFDMIRAPSDAAARPCGVCGKSRPGCPCDLAEQGADREASEWARGRDERIPLVSDGRIAGGNLERHDRDPVKLARKLVDGREWSQILRNYREWAVDRRKVLGIALRTYAAEDALLEEHAKILGMKLDGDGMNHIEIAAAFGFARTWATERCAEIEAHALVVMRRGAGEVLITCLRCGEPIRDLADKTSVRRFCGDLCNDAFYAVVGRRRKALDAACRRAAGEGTITLACSVCEKTFTTFTSGGAPRRYCGPDCKRSAKAKALRALRMRRKGVAAPEVEAPQGAEVATVAPRIDGPAEPEAVQADTCRIGQKERDHGSRHQDHDDHDDLDDLDARHDERGVPADRDRPEPPAQAPRRAAGPVASDCRGAPPLESGAP